ncbi:septation protein SepH [Nocardia flavorosea]|uniref:septation protein SepH n=1 Tax=Nocardia flavorosea TaxID=53429 RepID=UPI000A04ACFA|nr:septation protein SepH [Nocardia flavorosea]
MRELRVIGVTPDSAHIVCVDTESGQKFRLPADDKLRAAARGDLARFGQIEIEMEATMRPRDIQARIRAGASVDQVTQESGMPLSRVERFAYPVLLERARAAELAQKAHPIRPDGPAVEILIDVVTAAFTARGHTLDNAEWDAWKDEKGFWVAQLQWQNGRSEIAAHWRYQPDAHGGTVSPLDDPATDLIDPDFGRALRGLASILPVEAEAPAAPEPVVAEPRREPARPAAVDNFYEQRAVAAGGSATLPAPAPLSPGTGRPTGTAALPAGTGAASAAPPPAPAEPYRPPAAEVHRPPAAQAPVAAAPVDPPGAADSEPASPYSVTEPETPAPEPAGPAPVEPEAAPATSGSAPATGDSAATTSDSAPAAGDPAATAPGPPAVADPPVEAIPPVDAAESPAEPAAEPTTGDATTGASEAPAAEAGENRSTDIADPEPAEAKQAPESEPAAKPAAKKAPAKATKSTSRSKRGKAPMPSWEDVLLGVRSSGH